MCVCGVWVCVCGVCVCGVGVCVGGCVNVCVYGVCVCGCVCVWVCVCGLCVCVVCVCVCEWCVGQESTKRNKNKNTTVSRFNPVYFLITCSQIYFVTLCRHAHVP